MFSCNTFSSACKVIKSSNGFVKVNCTGMGANVAAADPSSVLVIPQNHSVSEGNAPL